ncbi:GlyGly-CTERM sorting domain-containing protein [Vibrio sp. vnigr-6D03]|uniref:DUF3466 family protein n=1 Tax=Vibrio sp. vnigr-6D03 TaxID=2058088 RepID=UPI000C34692D|nr:DUF3466 family protein [Vibrio sp. vnigr-6D03]PKF78051.1 GlyGly-CTERM sorting domain-containing protein [Vibrio sp. vnigr-6D03]
MSRNRVFKLSAITSLIIGATSAHAALYNIEVVSSSENENFGSAVSESTGVTNCFAEACASSSSNPVVASRGRIGEAGQWINDEMDFLFDNRFRFVDQKGNRDEYRKYCDYNLRYNTCEAWADRFFHGTNGSGGAQRVLNSFTWSTPFSADNNNTKAFLTSGSLISEVSGNISGTNEIVVNNFDGTTAIGNSSSGYLHSGSSNYARQYKSRGFYGSTVLEPIVTSQPLDTMGVTRAFDSFEYNGKTYVVGSSAFSIYGDESDCKTVSDPHTRSQCQNLRFNNQAVMWDVTNTASVSVTKVTDASSGTQSSQSSVRAATLDPNNSNEPVLVGYYNRKNSSDMLPEAAIFLPTFDAGEIDGWTTKAISGTTLNPDGYIYHSSIATDINQNMLVIGSTKRGNYDYKRSRTDVPVEEGSLNNRLWLANASSANPTATYLTGGIFFAGSGGDMRAVNDFNEIVGRIDAENVREVDGKLRRKRAFIYPYNVGSIAGNRGSIFQNKAWWLDDLTNDGSVSGHNNQFRIIDANDINNAGIISASAMMCAGGYKTTSHNASCSGTEKLVSIKLTPINGATASNIQQRTADKDPVERKGAGLGILLLGVLSLISFRRK